MAVHRKATVKPCEHRLPARSYRHHLGIGHYRLELHYRRVVELDRFYLLAHQPLRYPVSSPPDLGPLRHGATRLSLYKTPRFYGFSTGDWEFSLGTSDPVRDITEDHQASESPDNQTCCREYRLGQGTVWLHQIDPDD